MPDEIPTSDAEIADAGSVIAKRDTGILDHSGAKLGTIEVLLPFDVVKSIELGARIIVLVSDA